MRTGRRGFIPPVGSTETTQQAAGGQTSFKRRKSDDLNADLSRDKKIARENVQPYGKPPLPRMVTFLERGAFLGLALVLLLSGGFAIVAAHSTSAALHELGIAASLNAAYQEARYDVATDKSLERNYRLEPSAIARADLRAAEATLAAALRTIIADSDPVDRAKSEAVLGAHQEYVAATHALFDAQRSALVEHLDHYRADRLFAFVEQSVFTRAARQRILDDQILERVRMLQHDIIEIGIVLAVLRLVCFAAYIAVIVMYKRRISQAHRTEVLQLVEAALVDHLTGIGNHRAYKEDFERAVSRASLSGESLTLALLDIDEMKIINDQHGHMHGDQVLQSLGRLLQVLSAKSRAFRLGGDEFGVLLPNTSPDEARSVMEHLRTSAESTLFGGTISIGMATLAGLECDAETLQGQADAALYAAKRAGRNTLANFDATVDEMWLLSPARVRQLRNLIASDNISMVFQPIWDVVACSILAYEALARPAQEFGFSGPQDVFDLAGRVGRAHEIDALCRRATLRRANELPDGALLFLNVTPQSLDHGHLDPRQFAAEVIAAGLSPRRVVIEITERSIVPVHVVIKVAKELQGLGFRLALDDTGAGNAGLEMLSQLLVEFVKIDRGIVLKAMTDRSARGVMAGIIAIAKETGAYVIAEGIEDFEMFDFVCGQDSGKLDRHRVRGVQGHFLRRPSATMVAAGGSDDARSILLRGVLRKTPSL
jgi:diguanylate cyclase (GGDEF)-like protein